ncbi:MAG: LysE family translocator [Candidatus Dormiibacterota bacterium]
MDARFAAFVAISALLIVSPGPDMAMVTRNALRFGRHAALLTGYGVATGIAIWGLASFLGLAVLLESSAVAFTVLKLVGAAYLVVLGTIALVRRPHRSGAATDAADIERGAPAGRDRTAFAQGLLGNLLNPKAGIIFVTVLPQFIRPGDSPLRLLLMLATFEAILLGWLTLYGYLVVRTSRGRAGVRIRGVLNRVAGLVLIGLGVRLAIERS